MAPEAIARARPGAAVASFSAKKRARPTRPSSLSSPLAASASAASPALARHAPPSVSPNRRRYCDAPGERRILVGREPVEHQPRRFFERVRGLGEPLRGRAESCAAAPGDVARRLRGFQQSRWRRFPRRPAAACAARDRSRGCRSRLRRSPRCGNCAYAGPPRSPR